MSGVSLCSIPAALRDTSSRPGRRHRIGAGAALLVSALALGGCTPKAEVPTINATMTGVMEPGAETIWNTVSKAYNDIGDALDPAKLSGSDWQRIGEASRKLKERAEILATAEHLVVAAANEPILGSQAVGVKGKIGPAWDAVNAATVQTRIDADPEGFRQKARVLVAAADGMLRASQTRDAALLYKVSSGLDEVCDGCHEPFWGTDEPPPAPR